MLADTTLNILAAYYKLLSIPRPYFSLALGNTKRNRVGKMISVQLLLFFNNLGILSM